MPLLSISLSDLGIDAGVQKLLSGSTQTAGTVVTSEVQGLAELDAVLSAMPDKLAKKVIVAAIREGAQMFQSRAQEMAPENPQIPLGHPEWRTMRLKDGIKVQVTTKSLGAAGALVRGEIALDKKHAFFGRFVEQGHITAAGGQVAPQPYMRPAFESTKYRVLDVVQMRLWQGVEAIANGG